MKKLLKPVYRKVVNSVHAWQARNDYRGVYASFAEAKRAAPNGNSLGYDQPGAGSWYHDKLNGILHHDYPALYWMSVALKDSRSVYEIGGHVGLAFYGFERYLTYPPDVHWTICDVPSVVREGRRLATERGRKELRFVDSPLELRGADVVYAAGSLQYVESPDLHETIDGFSQKPKHIIVNKTPVWDGHPFATLQRLGRTFAPYLIRNRRHFVHSIESLGYDLVDSWEKERRFRVLWHPDKTFDHYSGFYFRRVC